MKNTVLELINILIEDLALQGLDSSEKQAQDIKAAYLKAHPPVKPKPIKKKVVSSSIVLEITEGYSTYSMTFDSDAKAETYLKKKQKERKIKLDLFIRSEGLTPPSKRDYSWQRNNAATFAKECQKYTEAIKSVGLDFEVIIKRT